MNNAAYRKLIERSKSTVDSDSNWLITLADVMTLLMVFFVMFLIAKQAESGRKSPEVTSAAVKSVLNNEVTCIHNNSEDKIRDAIARSIKELGIEKDVEVSLVNKDILITMTEGITFKSESRKILDKSSPIMGEIAESIRKNPSYTVEIDGHTDNLPIHTSQYPSNWELSEARATSVLKCFIDTYDIDPSRFYIRGYADRRPLVSNDSPEHRAQNRRVEIRLKNDPADLDPQV